MRRVLLTLALVAGGLTFSALNAGAASGDSAAEQAAREIAAARQQANDAAQAWEEAKVELEQLADEEAKVQQEQADLQAQVDGLSTAVQESAVNRFVSGSTGGIPLLNGLSGPNDQAQAEVLAGIVNDNSAAQLNDFEVASDELADTTKDLEAAQAKTRRAQQQLEAAQAEAEDLVVHLQEVEAQRLQDEAVQRELERIRAEERAQEAAEQQAHEQAAAQAAAQQITQTAVPQAAGPSRGGGSDESPATSSPAQADAPAQTDAPSNDAPSNDDDNGSDEGDSPSATQPTTTTDAPEPEEEPSFTDDGLACPAPGSAFGDTWGAARSGGRRHEGVDMMGPLGTPLYAVTSGTVQFKQTSLGGNSAWVNGDNGDRYFYAHLDSFEGESRSVSKGELIGYMGHTGNANGANHLHFEVHPGGGAAVNPYPTVRAIC